MSQVIQRTPDDADDLYVWWSGATLGPGAQVICGQDEVAIFFEGDRVLATLGAGSTSPTAASHPELAPYLERHFFGGPKPLSVCFITVRPWEGWEVEIDGGRVNLPDVGVCAISGRAVLTVQVVSPPAFVAKLSRAAADGAGASADEGEGDEEGDEGADATIDDTDDGDDAVLDLHLQQAVRVAFMAVVVEQTPLLPQLKQVVVRELPATATRQLHDFGIEVRAVTGLELYSGDQLLS
jgi:hypothetical protein